MSVAPQSNADQSPIAAWLMPILWREHDWVAALERLSSTATRANRLTGARAYRTAIELAQALEYIDPDRRKAIAAYELAGDHERARELASELGWWSARARLSARIIDSPEHVLDEAGAWWDAGHPDLCALALSEVRGSDRGSRGAELQALLDERELLRHAAEASVRAKVKDGGKGPDAAKQFMMAARFCRAAGRQDLVVKWLEAAVMADPDHPVAAPFLLELAVKNRDSEPLKRFLKLRLESASDLESWLDMMRACALTLVRSEHYRGFGQRLLKQVLQKAYTEQHAQIPGHIAMWTALASHATTAKTRRDLLPFVITALNTSVFAVDRVWLAAYATEITLRDGNNPVVAGAYAEIVAEYAPNHPIVRELVSTVANAVEDEPTNPIAIPIPIEAIKAARQDEARVEPVIDLETAYETASRSTGEVPVIVSSKPPTESSAEPAVEPPNPASEAEPPPATEPPNPTPEAEPPPASEPAAETVTEPVAEPPKPAFKPIVPPVVAPVVAPVRPGPPRPPPATRPATAQTANRLPSLPSMPSIPRVVPTLAALRTADRPAVPPPPADPPNATLRAHRIAVPIDVRLELPDGEEETGTSRDISTTGLFVVTSPKLVASKQLAVDSELGLVLLLPGTEAFTEDEFPARARIVRCADDGLGLELITPSAELVAALDKLG